MRPVLIYLAYSLFILQWVIWWERKSQLSSPQRLTMEEGDSDDSDGDDDYYIDIDNNKLNK